MRMTVRWLERGAVLALLAMMLLTTSDVVLRKLVNRPIQGVTEMVELALGVAIFFAVPGVFARGANIAVDVIDQWLPRKLHSLGTDGFGRSESRAALRNFFEVDARFITLATLYALMQEKQLDAKVVAQAITDLGIDTEKADPAVS